MKTRNSRMELSTMDDFKKQSDTLWKRELAAKKNLQNLSEEYRHIFIDSVNLLDKVKEDTNCEELKERTYRIQTILCDLLGIYFRMINDKKFVSLFCICEEAIQELYGDSTRRASIKSHDFIEITVNETNRKMLIRASEIKYVTELEGGNAEITLALEVFKKAWGDVTAFTQESYAEVIEKIEQTR